MKHIASIAGAALALSLVAAPAIAAPHGGNHNAAAQHNNQGGNQNGNARARRDNSQHQNNNNRGNWQNKGPQNNQAHNNGARNNNRGPNHNALPNNRNARADLNRFRRNFRSTQRFRVARYRAPASYNYRRWSYGQYLPFEYRARNFWLTNALVYGLFQAPPGLVWVRYGDDALLIDTYTGEIVQVRYDIFYW
jgi:Ni/Co efflux regulator RcnB